MDTAAGIAGLIGLAAVTAQSTANLLCLIKSVKDIPERLNRNMQWTIQLSDIIQEIQRTSYDIERLGLPIDVSSLKTHLKECQIKVETLHSRLTDRLNKLSVRDARKRLEALKAVYGAKETDQVIAEIQRATDSLSLCHTSMIR